MEPTIVLASTTDTPDQVKAALDGQPNPEPTPAPEPEAPVPPVAPPPGETTTDESVDENSEAAAAAAALAGRKGKLQKRIDDLIKDKHGTKKELDARDARIKSLEQQLSGLGTPPTPAAAAQPAAVEEPPAPVMPPPYVEQDEDDIPLPKPKLDDFDSIQDHLDATLEWRDKEKARVERVEAKQAHVAAAFKSHQERFVVSRDAARERYPDWNEAMESARSLHVPDMLRIEIQDSEVAGDLLYHFAKNPGDLADILSNHPNVGLKKLGVLEARLMQQLGKAAPAAAGGTPPAPPAPPARPATRPIEVSGAPEPVTTVGGSSTTNSQSMETMSYQDYKRARAAQIQASKR